MYNWTPFFRLSAQSAYIYLKHSCKEKLIHLFNAHSINICCDYCSLVSDALKQKQRFLIKTNYNL